jgi:hypothetical protein
LQIFPSHDYCLVEPSLSTRSSGFQTGVRRVLAAIALSVLLLAALQPMPVAAAPRPPCGGEPPDPPYPEPGAPPQVRLWHAEELGADWRPPLCTGWGEKRFDQLVALAGRLPASVAAEDLLAKLSAVSQWTGIRYWSVTRRSCRGLIEDAHALAGPDSDQRRPDFARNEMVSGKDLYFFEDDNGPGGGAVYRMRLHEVTPNRLVLETENVSRIELLRVVPLFAPGELRALYILQREKRDAWAYYSLSGTTAGVNPIARGHDASYVNRALALYAYLAGLDSCALAATLGAAG